MDHIVIRTAIPSDRPDLRRAVVELQEYERSLHATRLPGAQIANAYLDWIRERTHNAGALLVAENEGGFVGFIAGWIEQDDNIAETADSNRFGYISDICVLPPYRGLRVASRLLDAIELHFRPTGVRRLRIGVLAANKAARGSYEHAGFTPYEIIYEKEIAPGDA
jgi:ribosomal protein S18 acetylase RimI-like enzyme